MRKSLLFQLALLASITTSAFAQENISGNEVPTNTITVNLNRIEYLIDPASGFCFQNMDGQGALVSVDYPINDLKDFATSGIVEDCIKQFPGFKSDLKQCSERIRIQSFNFKDRMETCNRKIINILNRMNLLMDNIHACIDSLYPQSTHSGNTTATGYKNAGITAYAGSTSEFNMNLIDEYLENTYIESLRFLESFQSEFDLAAERAEIIILEWSAETDRILDISNQMFEKWNADLNEIEKQISANPDEGQTILLYNRLMELYETITKEHHDLQYFIENAIYRDPWAYLYDTISQLITKIENNDPEDVIMQAKDLTYRIHSYNLPSILIDTAFENESTIRIPSGFNINGNHIAIEHIDGAILPENFSTKSAEDYLTLVIPESVTRIMNGAFASKTISNVISEASIPPMLEGNIKPFLYASEWSKLLYVPDESVNAYKESDWSKYFNEILPISAADVAEIESGDMSSTPRIYTIQGIYVGDTIEGLPKGIYIIRNGKSCRKMAVE